MALSLNTDRRIQGGQVKLLRSATSAVPYEGSLLSINSSGYVHPLAAGEPFVGVCEKQIISRDQATANGGVPITARTGRFTMIGIISGVTIAMTQGRPRVYASDDGTLTLSELGNTYIGRIIDLFQDFGDAPTTNAVVILAETFDVVDYDMFGGMGSQTLSDAAATLTVAQLDMLLEMPNTVARTLTLPAAANCAGRCFWIKKTTSAASAVTLQGNASENIDGANTYATSTSQWASVIIRSDGTQWLIMAKI
jgi:hypothetical protein